MTIADQWTVQTARAALPRLDQAARNGDVEAARLLARWHLVGQLVPRDLVAARHYYECAAALGSPEARMTAIGWLAAGTAGPRDWRAAIDQLAEFADENERAAIEVAAIRAMNLDDDGGPTGTPNGKTLSERPSVIAFSEFLSASECNALIQLSAPYLRPATVAHAAVPTQFQASVRTCHSMAYPLAGESPFIQAINRRIAAACSIPLSHGEPTQIFRYEIGQQFKPHVDSGATFANQRVATFIVYLNDDYDGGETWFTKLGLTVKGKVGDALLFRNVDETGRPDPATEHAGKPVTRGAKWLLSRWLRERELEY